MKEKLKDFISQLREDKDKIQFYDEAKTRYWIIDPILDFLGWSRADIEPEYSVGGYSVDYSLKIVGKSKIFLEAKKPIKDLENHQEQLLKYAFHEGIELAVLSNGVAWWFYLPLEKGPWEKRRFFAVDLLEQNPPDVSKRLIDFLSRRNVESGKALANSKRFYMSQDRKREISTTLPKAWSGILKEPGEILLDILADKTEKICGYRPEDSEVKRFLKKVSERKLSPSSQTQALGQKSKQFFRFQKWRDNGLIRDGEIIYLSVVGKDYKKERATIQVNQHGYEYRGQIYKPGVLSKVLLKKHKLSPGYKTAIGYRFWKLARNGKLLIDILKAFKKEAKNKVSTELGSGNIRKSKKESRALRKKKKKKAEQGKSARVTLRELGKAKIVRDREKVCFYHPGKDKTFKSEKAIIYIEDNKVRYKGELYSFSKLAALLHKKHGLFSKKRKTDSFDGPKHWKLVRNGKTILELYRKYSERIVKRK